MKQDFKTGARRIFERRNAMNLNDFTNRLEKLAEILSNRSHQIRESHLIRIVDYWKHRANTNR